LLVDGGGSSLQRLGKSDLSDSGSSLRVGLSGDSILLSVDSGQDNDSLVALGFLNEFNSSSESVGSGNRGGVVELSTAGWVMSELVILLLLLFYKE
jgi:hypothetical protein